MDKVWLDQAVGLRNLLSRAGMQRVTLCSALPEPGRPWALLNLAAALQLAGSTVLVVDAAAGREGGLLASGLDQDTLMSLRVAQDWDRAVTLGPEGIPMLGVQDLKAWEQCVEGQMRLAVKNPLGTLDEVDIVLINTVPDATGSVLQAIESEQEWVIAVRPERASVAQTYQLIQRLSDSKVRGHFRLLVSGTASLREAKRLFEALSLAAKRSLHLELSFLGLMPTERYLRLAAEIGRSVVLTHPESWAASSFRHMAESLLHGSSLSHGAKPPALMAS